MKNIREAFYLLALLLCFALASKSQNSTVPAGTAAFSPSGVNLSGPTTITALNQQATGAI